MPHDHPPREFEIAAVLLANLGAPGCGVRVVAEAWSAFESAGAGDCETGEFCACEFPCG